MKKVLKFTLLFFGIYVSSILHAQHRFLDTAWVATSRAVATSYYHTATVVHSGQLIVTGNALNGSHTDVYTYKLDTDGDTLWAKSQQGSISGGNDYGIDLAVTSSGDVIVTAAVENSTTGYDFAIYRYSGSNGALEWSYTWDGNSGIDIPAKVLVRETINSIFLIGGSQATGGGFSDYGIVKVDTSGNFVWEHFYDSGSNLHDAAVSGLTMIYNQYLLALGSSNQSPGIWALSGRMVKVSDGSTFSTVVLDTTGVTMVEASAMAMDSLNNVYITGFGEVGGDKYIETIKIDSNLNLLWVKTFDNPYDDVGSDIAVDGSGNVYVTGYTGQDNGDRRAITLKYNSAGTEEWSELYMSQFPVASEAKKIELNGEGEIFITGTVEQDTIGAFFFNQYNAEGALLLSSEFESDTLDFDAYDIAIDDEDIYITGLSNGSGGATTRVLKYTLLEEVTPSYFYLNDEKSYWCQQPGMYSFMLYDNSEFVGYDPAIVSDSVYYPADGMHYVYFNSSATEAQVDSMISIIEADPKFSKEYMVATLTRNNDVSHELEYYAGLNNYICIIFEDPELTIAEIDSFAAQYETSVAFAPGASISGGVYVLEVDRMRTLYDWNSPTLTMDLARDMQEFDSLDLVKMVDPSMLMFRPDNPDDSLYTEQWWVEDNLPFICNGDEVYPISIDLDCAWNFENEFGTTNYYSGENIVVAVIDFHGVEFTHPDCNSMFTSYGYLSPASGAVIFPFNTDVFIGDVDAGVHGQSVCGIIGARMDNDEGIAGVAHNSKVMPCIMQGYTENFNSMLTAIREESGVNQVDVINMSFGYNGISVAEATGFTFYQNLQDCFEFGRPDSNDVSRGIVLVASAGNTNSYAEKVPAALPNILSVGATNPYDQRKTASDVFNPAGGTAWGGTYFNDLDVSAPGICIWTTDITDSNSTFPTTAIGYDTGNYYLFSGTSAAAPIVSGIAALVLEKDSMLTADEVYSAIRYSCEKVGGYSYSNGWETGRCLELGYGRVNACMALQMVDELSVSENPLPAFEVIHPNPVNGIFWARVNGTSNYSFTIVNIMGEVVYQSQNNSTGYFELDMSEFANGVYLLNVVDLDTQQANTSKIVKQ